MTPQVLSVSELTQQIQDCVDGNFPFVAVRGEISNCTVAGSGHVYLTLKDDDAQLRGVMWRSKASRLRFALQDGLDVVAVGAVQVYPARGTYQIVIDELIPQGVGALELAFRQLHAKLAAEGLFAPERKKPLPRFPRRIALVTSPGGAAVRDMLQVIARRWRLADVVIVPVPVQGEGAPLRIAAGIALLPRIPRVDVAIVGRGGGSLEDLSAFNAEPVARAIAASPVPIISAVGHEIDVTIADLVADRRALTPSEAAEIVVPDRAELAAALRHLQGRLLTLLRERAAAARSRLENVAGRRVFARPLERVQRLAERLDELESRLSRVVVHRHTEGRAQLATLAASLDALSPMKVLQRGYSITHKAETGEVIRQVEQVRPGDRLRTRLGAGQVMSRVEAVEQAEGGASPDLLRAATMSPPCPNPPVPTSPR
jgi:exodeoxyribonuclease VII large subunit